MSLYYHVNVLDKTTNRVMVWQVGEKTYRKLCEMAKMPPPSRARRWYNATVRLGRRVIDAGTKALRRVFTSSSFH
jgi:hypothetical protein